ncbi:MAG: DUF1838 family protein [Pseudomonadota bacterium]
MRTPRVALATVLTVLAASHVGAEEISLDGYQAFQARQKSTCGTTEKARTRYFYWEGRGYSRVAGEKDRLLFSVLGANIRQCDVVDDPVRGKGFRSVSREIMVYMDPETGEVIDTWTNPWTGQDVDVIHVANDPVNMRGYVYEKKEDGSAAAPFMMRRYGDVVSNAAEIPLFYTNPLAGDYQPYVGGTYHAMEIFDSFYPAKEMLSTRRKAISSSHLGWVRVSKWLPWMEMGDRSGVMIFNATGYGTFDKDEVPATLWTILRERYPSYETPPPLDDKRPNETSWTVFKKTIDARNAAE